MRALIAIFALVATLFSGFTALGQDTPGEADTQAATAEDTAAEERAAQFVGVTGPEAESIPGGPLLLGAYAVVWIFHFLFLMRMRGLQRQTAEELERLSAEIRAAEGG